MQRPWFLAEKMIHHTLCNGLGILEVSLMLHPMIVHPDRLASQWALLSSAIAAVSIDLWWRLSNSAERILIGLLFWTEGGCVVLIPFWVLGATVAGLCIFTLAGG